MLAPKRNASSSGVGDAAREAGVGEVDAFNSVQIASAPRPGLAGGGGGGGWGGGGLGIGRWRLF